MKRSLKKIGLVSIAAVFMGASINGLALAANSDDDKADRMEQTVPPMMHKMMKDIELTDAQKQKLETLKEKQKALRDEFWTVFTDEQKTAMLQKMMSREQRDMRGGPRGEGRHDKGPRDKGERKRWRDAAPEDTPKTDAEQ
ncbi:hypothetical protein [Alteromonas confluentis]|uniref:Zinc resistance-associated protein n=1 Tax=Alteromonas confluentis TaxID=1656094 RepID=A0A1E7ZC38_9ALTE|nr:hypothetical protein [Alteromonas confluentis]OFC71014.1 hypothetical protein BFC18_11310 [Alteromonas confluentis]